VRLRLFRSSRSPDRPPQRGPEADRFVAILVAGLPPERIGGAEKQAAQVARLLSRDTRVVVLTRTRVVPDDVAAEPGCTVIRRCRVDVPVLRFVADLVTTLMFLRRHRHRIDATLAYQTVIDGLIGALAKLLFGIPVVVSVRNEVEYALTASRQSRWLSPFVFSTADRILVQSPLLASGLLQAFATGSRRTPTADELRHKLRVISNGVDDNVTESRLERDLVLFVARLTPVKGAEFLVAAMRQCPEQRLVVIGDGPVRAQLQRLASGLANVSFAGRLTTPEVHAYLARAQVLVHPSLQEGQPNVILEAMAHGVPVIATRVGGIPDLIEEGGTGFLVDPGDTAALARYIRLICSDRPLWERMARRSRELVEQYRWPKVIAAVQQELASVQRA
jgi:glycosyltransferase involved in cell wall biosynthesis